jgi:lysozyme family protein
VNAGPRTCSRIVQLALGAEADGIIGQQTISQLSTVSAKEFLTAFTLAKVSYYAAICNRDKSQTKFLLGWINRSLGGN